MGTYVCLSPEVEQGVQKIDMVDIYIYYNVQKQKITFLSCSYQFLIDYF